DRREALDLELRDEAGQVFECEFMRVYDMYDMGSEWMDGELADDEATMSSADQEEIDAEVDEMLAAFNEAREHEDMFHSSWPPPPAEGDIRRLNPQRLDHFGGKIIRIVPDLREHVGTSQVSENGQYRIPNDNPFVAI